MSAVHPAIGDRFQLTKQVWQIIELGPWHKFTTRGRADKFEASALLRIVGPGKQTRLVTVATLLFDRWQYLGAFAVPRGYTIHKVGGHFYYRTPAGNVDGAPEGSKWTELDCIRAAHEHAKRLRRDADRYRATADV